MTAMWVRFVSTYDFKPPEQRNVTIRYRPGNVGSVRRCCGNQAISMGLAVELDDWRSMRRRAREEQANGRT